MAQSKTEKIYRVEIDNKYGWFVSTYGADQFDQVLKRQLILAKRNRDSEDFQPTEIQQTLLKLAETGDYGRVHYKIISTSDKDDYIARARIIIGEVQHYAPEQVFGQSVSSLYFIAGLSQHPLLSDLQKMMNKYPQFNLGWPIDADKYQQQMMAPGENEYTKLRAQALKYWFDQAGGDLSWLYSSEQTAAQMNYAQTYQWLRQNKPELINWYYDQPSDTMGMIWHFTDINNMANILSYQEITSKNYGQANSIIENDNAAASVNVSATKPWVHDFARFYLRPQTPTQYRNEGIYQYHGDHPDFTAMPKSLVNYRRDGFWTTGKPAHLPVPVFIGFSLKKFLQRGGHLTKGSLAGKRVADQPAEMYDDDLSFLCENVADIYSDRKAPSYLKHTEFIVPDKMTFDAADILRIVVRSEAEKIVLLTMLTEHDSFLFSNKQAHQAIDPQKYIDRIVVDPGFFYFNGSTVQTGAGTDTRNQYHLHLQPAVAPENLTRVEKQFGYEKTVNGNELQVSVPELKQVTLKVRDVNGEEKVVARFHDPDWILGASKWIPSKRKREISAARGYVLKNRYYSTLYYHGQYCKLWREEGANEWHLVGSHQAADILTPADQAILKKVEESCREEFKPADIPEFIDPASILTEDPTLPGLSDQPTNPGDDDDIMDDGDFLF